MMSGVDREEIVRKFNKQIENLKTQYADEEFKDFFPCDVISPEEYAARYAHNIHSYMYDLYGYRDARIGDWARRLGFILQNATLLDECMRKYLTKLEYDQIKGREN